MADRYRLTDETKQYAGKTLHRVHWIDEGREGGWISKDATMPQGGTAVLYGDVKIIGGVFHDGVFHDGLFMGGVFRGGEFWGGEFRGGVFRGGEFWGGEFMGGVFMGGEFRGGEFCGGAFWGGEFYSSPCCAQRHDGYMFVAKFVGDELRIWAGCRDFSWEQAVAHWNDAHRHGAESQRIIHFLKAQAEAERDRDAARA